MSPLERSAWICLASIIVVFVPYFIYVLHVFERDGAIAQPILVAFVVAGIAHGILNRIAQALMAVRFGITRRDERDAAIDARSMRVA